MVNSERRWNKEASAEALSGSEKHGLSYLVFALLFPIVQGKKNHLKSLNKNGL